MMRPLFLLGVIALGACSSKPSPSDGSPDADVKDAGAPTDAEARLDAHDTEPLDTGNVNDDATASDAESSDTRVDAGPLDSGPRWPRPSCAQITGTAGVTFSFDEGATLNPTRDVLAGVSYTMGLTPLGIDGLVLAIVANQLLKSTDSGCSWKTIGPVAGGFPPRLAAAGPARAYAWSENNPELYRIDGEMIRRLGEPVGSVLGLGVDSANPDHLRIADGEGQLFESFDGGDRFDRLGTPAFPGSGLVYRGAFDPKNLDHVLVGAATGGAKLTRDGGRTWSIATGFSVDGRANIFNVVISPASSNVVWAQGIDLVENLANAPGEGRHVYLSTDGGSSFSPVVDQSGSVTLTNGPLLVPHPTNPNVLYFIFGTYFQGYGTDVFRYEHGVGLTKAHNDYQEVGELAFGPGDPQLMYLGVIRER
ncbi:MAG: dispase autolysis-inducing protein [Deltaproteobacteria bacterium]|nr:dispase autolysis-inducing protein [Deltaproteobacteria bacterium]